MKVSMWMTNERGSINKRSALHTYESCRRNNEWVSDIAPFDSLDGVLDKFGETSLLKI